MNFIIALTFLIAGISAMPQAEVSRFVPAYVVTEYVINAIDNVSLSIMDAGLDPLIITREVKSYALPVPVIFNATAVVDDVLSFGLSDIRIGFIRHNIITQRLDLDLKMPNIHLSAGHASAEVTVFGKKLRASVNGSIAINDVRAVGHARVRTSSTSGYQVRSVTVDFTVGSINSGLNLVIQNQDLSKLVNTFIGETIPATILAFRSDINKLIEIILLDFFNAKV